VQKTLTNRYILMQTRLVLLPFSVERGKWSGRPRLMQTLEVH